MSEQNILNPAQTSLFNPDWGYSEGLPEMRAQFQAASGNIFQRQQQGPGRVIFRGGTNDGDSVKDGREAAGPLEAEANKLRDDPRGR